jgi:hypothetical protein
MNQKNKTFWKNVGIFGGLVVGAATLLYMHTTREFDHLEKLLPLQVKDAVRQAVVPISGEVTSVRSRLDTIDGELKILAPEIESLLLSKFKKFASQPVKDVAKNLAEFHQSVKAARLLKVRSSPELLKQVSLKLSKVNRADPDYWPATAEFISYRSENLLPRLAGKVRAQNLPKCIDQSLKPSVVIAVPAPNKVSFDLPYYEDCKFTLDDPTDEARVNQDLARNATGVAFKNALIEYHGGEISIQLLQDSKNPNRKISSLVFENCVYDFTMTQNPSPAAEKILNILLLETSGDIAIPPGTSIRLIPSSHQ